jgi:CHAD domain-containing protein
MSTVPTIEQIQDRYSAEFVHIDHVTSLALQLFDVIHAYASLPAHFRSVLEYAARLHDIGYCIDKENHALQSALIVRSTPLAGLPSLQRDAVAACIRLHQPGFSDPEAIPWWNTLPDQQSVLRCAGILRIADGLDHSHIQDTTIVSIDVKKNRIVVSVRIGWYGKNVEWTLKKADLFNRVFPFTLSIRRRVSAKKARPFGGVILPSYSVENAARCILYSQYRCIVDNRDAICTSDDPEYLHDMRVAVRRFRHALRLFKHSLPSKQRNRLKSRFSDAVKTTGAQRDLDVLLAFCISVRKKTDSHDPRWQPLIDTLAEQERNGIPSLRRNVREQVFNDTLSETALFLRCDLMQGLRTAPEKTVTAFAAETIMRLCKRIAAYSLPQDFSDTEAVHRLRRFVRKQRYTAEFFQPLYPATSKTLIAPLKKATRHLGTIHDMDIAVERLSALTVTAPEILLRKIARRRKESVRHFIKKWHTLSSDKFHHTVASSIKE